MSRSYKHTPIIRHEKEDYRILNRKVRRNKNTAEIDSHGGYRRFSLHWHTWKVHWAYADAIKEYYDSSFLGEQIRAHYATLEDYLDYWKKCVYYKQPH